MGEGGIRCAVHGFQPYAALGKEIRSDGEGGLVWLWICPEPTCAAVLRSEPFAFPPDMPALRAADVAAEG